MWNPPWRRPSAQSDEAKDSGANIKIDGKFDCGTVLFGYKMTPTRFHIDFGDQEVYMFYFRIKGVAGKTVRIDLKEINPTSTC